MPASDESIGAKRSRSTFAIVGHARRSGARPEGAMRNTTRRHLQSSGYLKIEPVGVRVDIHSGQAVDFVRIENISRRFIPAPPA
jgi:hypothetical protein